MLDTGALIALSNSRDKYHLPAKNSLDRLVSDRFPLYITIPTIYETQRRLLLDLGIKASSKFLTNIFDGSINIEKTSTDDDMAAKTLTEKYSYMPLTLTDAVNMTVMIRLGIAKIFSFDEHFIRVGFLIVPPVR
jgi:predicted nucleic acid-binding protein